MPAASQNCGLIQGSKAAGINQSLSEGYNELSVEGVYEMFRVWLIPVLALISVVIPSVAQAQIYVVPSCTDPAVMSRSSYDRPVPCVPLVPVPPTGVPAWLRPVPIPPPPASVVPIDPTPVYVPPSRGLAPWIPLALR